jgi:MoaA/NifB/PqqE/SkfB family radical SAM enzyme
MNIISVFKRFRLFKKHFSTFAPYITPKKIYNLALNEYEMRTGKVRLKSLPPFIKVDPTPVCNLRCPGCSQSDPEFKRRFDETNHLTIDNIKTIIEPLKDTLLGVSLSLSGEPFTNPNLTEIISYLHKNKISVNFPSNFSSKFSEEQLEKIIQSGLDTIYISLDGISEESYKQYRVGGSFDLVRKNVERLAAMKSAMGKRSLI